MLVNVWPKVGLADDGAAAVVSLPEHHLPPAFTLEERGMWTDDRGIFNPLSIATLWLLEQMCSCVRFWWSGLLTDAYTRAESDRSLVRNFPAVVDKILNVDVDALNRLIDRGKGGEYVQANDDAEKQCFELMGIVDHVAGHVQDRAPVFFITFAPVDVKHPLWSILLWENIDVLSSMPNLPDTSQCFRAIANNPVACARFFHFMVEAFLKHILKVDTEEVGLFGKTEAYYGTVEAQGRLTLHLHLLLWLVCHLSPQEIRDRLLVDGFFRNQLIEWLESCQTGGFSTGSMDDITDRLQQTVETHHGSTRTINRPGVRDPATTLPVPPPQTTSTQSLEDWHQRFVQKGVDADLLRSVVPVSA
ncbi:hypothetical protein A0H81_05659 [Grifola frondosa]|uniref:Helitron helicase-like domain-containing protein n=1 Tax=Grifola frondosa TaxID=5627 RepID=A0A1C7MDW8_GRIFR|nr:hypothetical protein A0H81_05659 [Grifola frondosa]